MKIIHLILFSFFLLTCKAQEPLQSEQSEVYTLVTYNIENLFDADGVAVFNDYKTNDRDGDPQYTPDDVLTKINNAIEVMKQYNEGKGPDIIAMVELESDFTPAGKAFADAGDFLGHYSYTTLDKMLTTSFDEQIANLPSEWLLLKGMVDAGKWNYQVEVGHPTYEQGEPSTVQKTAVFSRFPVMREKTKTHPLERARPILEAWIEVEGNEMVVFVNHWKSGASSAEMEEIRLQNAEVLRARLNELLAEDPDLDVVLAGDFNSDYNQNTRYDFEKTAVNDVLRYSGNERAVSTGKEQLYNLWYELPIDQRGSDTYRGYWGTLMQIIISRGMYDGEGIDYLNDSFERGDFGFNTYSSSGEPKRWSSSFSGSGYSDHLPVSMEFKVAEGTGQPGDFSVNDDSLWRPNPVNYTIPEEFLSSKEFTSAEPTQNPEFFNEYFYLTGTVTGDYNVVVDGNTYDVYAPSFRLGEVLEGVAGTEQEIRFYGRFSQYRGNWQFVIESPEFIEVVE